MEDPHRSESRVYLARPTRTGPFTKEQFATVRKYGQRKYPVVARAKATTGKAEEAAKVATVDVPMREWMGLGGLSPGEEI